MLGLSACSSGNLPNLKTVEKVDLDRYQGDWTEIARIDHWFQEGCINSTANYTMREDGDMYLPMSTLITLSVSTKYILALPPKKKQKKNCC